MDTILLLNTMEVGTPLIITTKWQDKTIRKVTLYGGIDNPGVYNFIDDTGHYKMTIGYIGDHVTISKELDQENDLFELAKLIKDIKGGI